MAKTDASKIKTLFGDIKNVWYKAGEFKTTDATKLADLDGYLEFPVLEDGVSFNTGDADVTEVKLTTGAIWTSKADKGDSDISFQVASIDDKINSIFLKKIDASLANITVGGVELEGRAYSLAPKKATGHLVMFDESGEGVIILPSVEMFGALVAGDGDNPAYFNVSVTPVENSEGVDFIQYTKPTTEGE